MFSSANVKMLMSFFLILTTSCTGSNGSTLNNESEPTLNKKYITNNSSNEQTVIHGNLSYYQRIALPANSIATITLSDISIADRSAPVITSETIELLDKQVPIPFKLMVNMSELKVGMFYSVRGQITDPAGQLIWSTDTSYLIDPSKQENDLGLLKLVAVNRIHHVDKGLRFSLQNKEWLVENIAGGGVVDNSHTTLFFGKKRRISGHAGCNNYTGFYALKSKSLVIKNLVVTQRACVPALADQEEKFIALLESIVSFSINNTNTLILKTKHGERLVASKK